MNRLAWGLVALLAALLLVVGPIRGPARAGPPGGWEYRTLAWGEADTAWVLRRATGSDELADPIQLAQALEHQGPLLDDPKVNAAVDARLGEKLAAAGEEGWEAFWVREGTALAGGAPLHAPSLLLKRPRP